MRSVPIGIALSLVAWVPSSGRGTARAEDAQGTPTQSHISPSILVYEDEFIALCGWSGGRQSRRASQAGEGGEPMSSQHGTYKAVKALAVRHKALDRFKVCPLCSAAVPERFRGGLVFKAHVCSVRGYPWVERRQLESKNESSRRGSLALPHSRCPTILNLRSSEGFAEQLGQRSSG